MTKRRDDASKREAQGDTAKEQLAPVVSIYQNPDHVAGLVQQIFNAPLVTGLVVDSDQMDEATKNTSVGADLEGSGKAAAPVLGQLVARFGGKGEHTSGTAITTTSRSSQSFVYSQAYYLNLIRQELSERELLVNLTSDAAVNKMQVGDFVEFQATFTAPSLASVMDVLTPDLVGTITEYMSRKSGREDIDFSNFDGIKGAALELDMKATADRDLATSITRALQADFRQTSTREYYGRIEGGSELTAVTICDADCFMVDDEDRILDGSYRVLGKVTSMPRKDRPVLERNKLLSNIAPDAMDQLVDSVKTRLESSNEDLPIGKEPVEALMQVELESRVPGNAFQVIPVAIFV